MHYSHTLSEEGAIHVHAASVMLQKLCEETFCFVLVNEGHFKDPKQSEFLLSGKRIRSSGVPLQDFQAWNKSKKKFDHAKAVSDLVSQMLRDYAEKLVSHICLETRHFEIIEPQWIVDNPSWFPVIVNAMGSGSIKEFKAKFSLNSVRGRTISLLDAKRLVEALKGHKKRTEQEIVASLETSIEGIVRDLIGKVINEDFVKLALDAKGLSYARDTGGNAIIKTSGGGASRVDFVLPSVTEPNAFIEVRKTSSGHAATYAASLAWVVVSRLSQYPNCLAILVYDGEWTKPALATLESVFDHVFHVFESDKAAEVVRRHLEGEDMRKRNRKVYLTTSEPSFESGEV
jgi:hypothetical protein